MQVYNSVSWLISPGFRVGVLKKKNNMENKPKIVWATMDSERTLKQHAYIEKIRGGWYKYSGNKALSNKGGVHNGDQYVPIDEIQAEEISDSCCKRCLKIYQNLSNKN